MSDKHRWVNRAEEGRLRCRATEVRHGKVVQCIGHSRIPHEHENRGKKFGPDYQMPMPGTPTIGLSPVRL